MKHFFRLLLRIVLHLVAVFAISVGCRQILDLDERQPHPLEVLTHLAIGLSCWTVACLTAPISPRRKRGSEAALADGE